MKPEDIEQIDHEALFERTSQLVNDWAGRGMPEDDLDADMLRDFAFPIGVAGLAVSEMGDGAGGMLALMVMPCLLAAFNLGRHSVESEGREFDGERA